MCRGRLYCTEFGDVSTWSRRSTLPPPAWLAQDILKLAGAVELAANGRLEDSRAIVQTLREAEARDWYVEHAQVAANHRRRVLGGTPEKRVASSRSRTPVKVRRLVWSRDHYRCRYCDLPTIPPERIKSIRALVGHDILPWGGTNASRHGTLFLARAEYDHVVPVSIGGPNTVDNLVTACPSCNYGKDRWTVQELGLDDPRATEVLNCDWNGLSHFMVGH